MKLLKLIQFLHFFIQLYSLHAQRFLYLQTNLQIIRYQFERGKTWILSAQSSRIVLLLAVHGNGGTSDQVRTRANMGSEDPPIVYKYSKRLHLLCHNYISSNQNPI